MNVLYYKTVEGFNMYFVPNHYSHNLKYIEDTLEYAKSINCTLPAKDQIKVETLAGDRWKGMLSVEFTSITKPSEGMELTKDSGLWRSLLY
jgi:hypothetical protein